jgi:hypothetical protein
VLALAAEANASDKAAVIEAAAWLPCRQPILEVEVSVKHFYQCS